MKRSSVTLILLRAMFPTGAQHLHAQLPALLAVFSWRRIGPDNCANVTLPAKPGFGHISLIDASFDDIRQFEGKLLS